MTASTGKHRVLPLGQQQNHCAIVEQEKYTHIPMSFTSRLHCSKRGPRFEQQNVFIPQETIIIDKKPSVYRKQLGTNFGEICNIFIFHLRKLISRRQVGELQLLESMLPGTITASRTAKTGTIHNTTMTRDERDLVPCASQRTTASYTERLARRNESHSPSRHRSVKVAPLLTVPKLSAQFQQN